MPDLKSFKRRAAGHKEQGTEFRQANLDTLFAPGAVFEACRFIECRLSVATFNEATLLDCKFDRCQILGTSFRAARLSGCTFGFCDLVGCAFDGARLRDVWFEDCNLESASFLATVMSGAVVFERTRLAGADLRFYEVSDGSPFFRNSDLRQTVFQVNCEFWNGTFDERAIADFGRVYARASKDEALIQMVKDRWGSAEYDAVDAYMRRG